jgi:hypothetical protein
MNAAEVRKRLKETEMDDMTVTLTGREWTVIAVVAELALDAGCPAKALPTAIQKIADAHRQQLTEKWAEVIQ